MASGQLRRGAVALLAGMAVTVTPAVFLLAPASAAGATITGPSCRIYSDPLDGDVLIGEVQNVGTAASGPVSIDVTWLDGTGAPLGPPDPSVTSSVLQAIPPGPAGSLVNRSPFRANVPPPPSGTKGCRIDATPDTPVHEPNHNFTVALSSKASDPADADGFRHITGTVANNNTTAADDVNIVVTLYNAAGKVVDEAVGFPSGSSTTLAAAGSLGDAASFDLPSEGSGQPYATAVAVVESTSLPAVAPAPTPSATSPTPSATATDSASPTPTPTSASPSPTTTDTASPTPTPTPTATTPALPCRVGGGAYTIASSPSSARIAKGGRIRLSAVVSQAGRPCQSGVRLSTYVRGPGTTVYHLSRGAYTAAGGKAVFDYTGVRADFRWYVLSSGAHSATNLVQAR